mmetsp:Transcript_27241/g.78348  ORF Transcript_27241/g.78348 Transcript_27241/m.78348 type:complete len:216 (+) Transcript_27241:120-767(+)
MRVCDCCTGGGDEGFVDVKTERVIGQLKSVTGVINADSPQVNKACAPVLIDAAPLGRGDGERTSGNEVGSDSSCEPPSAKRVLQEFLRSASVGRRLTVLREGVRASRVDRMDATLQISQDLGRLTITASSEQLSVNILQISDIYAPMKDGAEVFSKNILQHLADDEPQRLLMLYYKSSEDKLSCLVMLESSTESVGHFMQSVSVLKAHAAQRVQQ